MRSSGHRILGFVLYTTAGIGSVGAVSGQALAEGGTADHAVAAWSAGETVTHSGTIWVDGSEAISGGWSIEDRTGEDGTVTTVLRLDQSFSTTSGPDLKIALHPQPIDRVTKKNALDSALVLGLLSSSRGASEYVIPSGTDLSRYRSLAIHCERETVLWGGAALTPGRVVASTDSWKKFNGKTSGVVEIAVLDEDRIAVRFSDAFRTKNAPDLKVVLSPLTGQTASNSNALRSGTVLGVLTSNRGSQEYVSQAPVDLGSIRSVLIHCEEYTKLWAVADVSISKGTP